VFDGRGLLKPDTFAEDRLLLLPPAVCTLLVLFNRNHNVSHPPAPPSKFLTTAIQYIARKLLEINERGTWKRNPDTAFDMSNTESREQALLQDEEIFQIARLCNCAWFGSAIFSDYFSSILGLVRLGSTWSLNPFGVSLSFLIIIPVI
jgi:linoleate 10R-lipoxygenase